MARTVCSGPDEIVGRPKVSIPRSRCFGQTFWGARRNLWPNPPPHARNVLAARSKNPGFLCRNFCLRSRNLWFLCRKKHIFFCIKSQGFLPGKQIVLVSLPPQAEDFRLQAEDFRLRSRNVLPGGAKSPPRSQNVPPTEVETSCREGGAFKKISGCTHRRFVGNIRAAHYSIRPTTPGGPS